MRSRVSTKKGRKCQACPSSPCWPRQGATRTWKIRHHGHGDKVRAKTRSAQVLVARSTSGDGSHEEQVRAVCGTSGQMRSAQVTGPKSGRSRRCDQGRHGRPDPTWGRPVRGASATRATPGTSGRGSLLWWILACRGPHRPCHGLVSLVPLLRWILARRRPCHASRQIWPCFGPPSLPQTWASVPLLRWILACRGPPSLLRRPATGPKS